MQNSPIDHVVLWRLHTHMQVLDSQPACAWKASWASLSAMRVLVVGAGAVGQVYGRHLALGGAEVSFFVREKYAAECRAGFVLYPLNRPKRERTRPVRFDGAGVVTSTAEVAAKAWDMVFLTVSSTALRGPWLGELAAAIGDATVVMLQPGPDDRAVALEHVPAERLVQGLITLISYPAPLPGETRFPGPGMAYWFPPLAPAPFSGPKARRDAAVAALKAGGQPAKRHADVGQIAVFPTAVLMPLLVHLEHSRWSLGEAFAGDRSRLDTALAGVREALAITERHAGVRRPLAISAIARGLVLRLGTALARKIVPLDLETYLRVHFTKVGDQTRLYMHRFVELGHKDGLPVVSLERLLTG